MNRKRPAQRPTRSRSVVKSKTRSFVPARGSRTRTPQKKLNRGWFSKRKSPQSFKPKKRTVEVGSWWQTILLWLFLLFVGGWLIWYILIWGVGPKLLAPSQSSTIAVLPASAGGAVLVAQLEPELKESTVFMLDGEEQVTLPGEYGEYRLSAIYPLLLIDLKDERYFRGTLNRALGIFLDNEVVIDQLLSSDTTELSHQLKQAFWQQLLSNKKPSFDLLRVWYVLQYGSTTESVSALSLVDEIRARTGGTFAARDECRMAILNSTTTSGLAGGLADIVEKNGGIVIRLGRYPNELETSKLLYDPTVSACQEAIEQIRTLSPVPFEEVEDTTVLGEFRAPIVAIIGKNFE